MFWPILFVIFINDLPEVLPNDSEIYLYADDTKLYRDIRLEEDRSKLQEDIHCMYDWSQKWLLKFHPDKCVTMSVGNTSLPEKFYNISPEFGDMKKK